MGRLYFCFDSLDVDSFDVVLFAESYCRDFKTCAVLLGVRGGGGAVAGYPVKVETERDGEFQDRDMCSACRVYQRRECNI